MFKEKITLLNEDWGVITKYDSKFKPNIDELIYSYELDKYFSVINVIHSIGKKYEILVIVKPYNMIK